jgi:hypothetical protein
MASSELLHRAIYLARTGGKPAARQMLDEVVRVEPYNTTAWLWLADTQATLTARARVLETCLVHNPSCQTAQIALTTLRAQTDYIQQANDEANRLSRAEPDQPVESAALQELDLAADDLVKTGRVRAVTWLYYVFSAFILVGVIALIITLIPRRAVGSLNQESIDLNLDPVQQDIPSAQATPFKYKDWFFTWSLLPRAQYELSGRVLVNQEYTSNVFDMRSRLCPMDLGLGWKGMGDPQVDEWITWWNQSDRTLHFSWETVPPYSNEYIYAHASNNHVIPATKNLETALKSLKRNDSVYMEGLLVDARTKILGMVFTVNTSMVRNDAGEGACETFYVTRLVVNGKEYR